MPYFMHFDIAFSKYEKGVGSLVSYVPDNGCISLSEKALTLRYSRMGHASVHQ
jgi:hypothetical protein